MRAILSAGVVATVLAVSSASAAERVGYDLSIRGFKVGELTLNGTQGARQYSVSGLIRNSGLTRMFRQFSYRGAASGRVSGGRLWPSRYEEVADTGQRSSSAVISYSKGVPKLVSYSSPRAAGQDSPDPSTQGGTVDPLTAIFGLLGTVSPAQACKVDYVIFDGKRQSRLFMRPAGQSGGVPVCKGQYQRLKGFTPDEVARHRTFDFVLSYQAVGGGRLAVAKVSFDSLYGTALIERR